MVAAEGTEGEEGTEMALNAITGAIIGAAIEVHKALGPGLLESAYQECLERELIDRGHRIERQRSFPVVYKGAAIKRRLPTCPSDCSSTSTAQPSKAASAVFEPNPSVPSTAKTTNLEGE